MSRFHRLPPVKAMRALEALERLKSAGAVADELSLTRSAVSHMLRRLEEDLGFSVSEPDGRGVRLTPRGRRYAQEARRALDIMTRAAAEEPALSGELRVVAPPGLATFWLADRIGLFADQFPDIRVNLVATRDLGDMTDEAADVQMAFGEAAQLRDRAELFSHVELFPVCAPSMLSSEPGLRKASDLERVRLLHLVTQVDWQRWLEAAWWPGVFRHADGADGRCLRPWCGAWRPVHGACSTCQWTACAALRTVCAQQMELLHASQRYRSDGRGGAGVCELDKKSTR